MTWFALTDEQARRIRAELPKRTPDATATRVLKALDLAAAWYARRPMHGVLTDRREWRRDSQRIRQAIGELEARLDASDAVRLVDEELTSDGVPVMHLVLPNRTLRAELRDVLARFAATLDDGPAVPGRPASAHRPLARRVGALCAEAGLSRAKAGRVFLIVAKPHLGPKDRIGRALTWVHEGYDAAQKMQQIHP